MAEIVNLTNIEKENKFFEDFFLYFAKQCRNAIKGVKIGHVFVTQAQVNMIKTRGIMNVEDIDRGNENVEVDEQDKTRVVFPAPVVNTHMLKACSKQ